MYVRLLTDRVYRDKHYKAGDVIETSDSLGGQMILNGVAVSATSDVSLDDMSKKELIEYAKDAGVEVTSSMNKAQIIDAIKGE